MEIIIVLAIVAYVAWGVRKKRQEKFIRESVQMLHAHSTGLMEKRRAEIEAQGLPFIYPDHKEGIFQMVDFPYKNFEDWYAVFRNAAFEANPAIAPSMSESGKMLSIIDFLDTEPCQRAYSHHLAPEKLGKRFGETFDMDEIEMPDGTRTGDIVEEIMAEQARNKS